ncbi:MAG: hypothetical protein AAB358_03435 [Patescibacteria group bacterium]
MSGVIKAKDVEDTEKEELSVQRREVFWAIRMLINHLFSEKPPMVSAITKELKIIFGEILRLGMVNELALFLGKISKKIPANIKEQLKAAAEQVLQKTIHEEVEGMFNGLNSRSPITPEDRQAPELQGLSPVEFPIVRRKKAAND